MHVIRVSPLAALPLSVPQVLDYFWTAPLPEGALVNVMVGRRAVVAVVLESLDLAQAKLAIKKGAFGLKKITSVAAASPQTTAQQLQMARWLSQQYHAPLGLCLKTVLPSWLGTRGKSLILPTVAAPAKRAPASPISYILVQPDTALTEIKKRAAGAGQVLLVVPEYSLVHALARALDNLAPLQFHSELTGRTRGAAYRAVLDGTASFVIGTRSALFLPWQNLTQVIVEDPLHEAYKSEMAPRYAAADAARELARIHGASLTYLSPALSTVNRYLADKDVFKLSDHKPYWPSVVMADMSAGINDGNRSILSRQAQDVILDAYDSRQQVLLYSPRRAYSSMLLCQRCRQAVQCTTCGIPMRVHRYTGELTSTSRDDMLVCYHCTAFTAVIKQCPSCHAGPLRPSGIAGSQKIAQAVSDCLDRNGLTRLKPPVLDSDLVRTAKDEQALMERLDVAEHRFLVATQMVLSHRYERRFDHIIIVAADALSYNPDFRTQERLIYQLEKLADFKPTTMTVQFWNDHGALSAAPDRSWSSFYEQELSDRKALNWPPFTRIVKLAFSHRERGTGARLAAVAADRFARAAQHLKVAKRISILGPTPALVERSGGTWTQNLVIKSSLTPHALNELLTHVPAGAVIDIDPRSIS